MAHFVESPPNDDIHDTNPTERRRWFGYKRTSWLVSTVALALATVPQKAHAETAGSVSTDSVRQMTGLPQHDATPLEWFGSPDAVSDLLIRCWSRPSSDWAEFRNRYQRAKCTWPRACAYLELFRASQANLGALTEHIKGGSTSTGFAIVAMFAREPATRDRLLALLPSEVAKETLATASILDWLWLALNREHFFESLAMEHALDQPLRGTSGSLAAYDPFLKAGRSLGFVWRRELEQAITRQRILTETEGAGSDGINCKTASALFKMDAIGPSMEAIDAFAALNSGPCSIEPIVRSFEMTAHVACCIWDVGSVVLGGLRGSSEPSFVSREIVAGRLREATGNPLGPQLIRPGSTVGVPDVPRAPDSAPPRHQSRGKVAPVNGPRGPNRNGAPGPAHQRPSANEVAR